MNPYGYSRPVWDLFQSAPRAGSWPAEVPDVLTGRAGTRSSRAVLQLQVRHDGRQVTDARFQAYGCPTTIAVGAWLAQWAVGRELEALRSVTAATLREALEIPEERAHCAFVGEDAVKVLLSRVKNDVHPVD
jgi:NifU-like protein involved in Fe-S cluster formation